MHGVEYSNSPRAPAPSLPPPPPLFRPLALFPARIVVAIPTLDDRGARLIPEGAVDPKYIEDSMDTPDTGSFMHLHLGIDGKGLDDLDIHYSVSLEMGLRRTVGDVDSHTLLRR